MCPSISTKSLNYFLEKLRQNDVIAYPTEAVYGLGCDPDSWQAVAAILTLKQRSVDKGLILIASDYAQLQDYVDEKKITSLQKLHMLSTWPGPLTWVVPAKHCVPRWLTGQFDSLAVRVSAHPQVRQLCAAYGKAIVSTSANLSGLPPCRTAEEVIVQFGKHLPVVPGKTGGQLNPSQICDIISGKIIR